MEDKAHTSSPPKSNMASPQQRSMTSQTRGGDVTDARRAQSFLPLPPDGGYGWVVVVACFICNGIVEGSVGSFGIFLPYFIDAFGTSRAKTTIAGSLLIGGFLVSGPVVSALINCFGCRLVTITGSVITVLAFTLSTLTSNIDVFITIYGFIGGLGLAMVYLPAMVMVGYYFEQRRSLATGIAYSGAGVGMLVMAPISAALLTYYDWRNALILFAAFPIQGIVLGALMRPLEVLPLDSKKQREAGFDTEKHIHPQESASGRVRVDMPLAVSLRSLSNRILGQRTSILPDEEVDVKKTQSMFILPPNVVQESHELLTTRSQEEVADMKTQSCVDLPAEPHSRRRSLLSHKILNRTRTAHTGSPFISFKELSQHPEELFGQIDMRKLREEISKPLARQDIFYSGSVHHLAEYRQQPDLQSYIASVTMVSREDMARPASGACPCVSSSTVTTVLKMTQCSLLGQPYFLVICLASVFIQLGYFIPIVFISNYAMSIGVSEHKAALLIAVIGMANTIGRTGAGALGNMPSVNTLHLNNICLIISGLATLLTTVVCLSFETLVVYACIFGMLMGAFVPLTTIFLVKYLGLQCLNNAMGLLTMVRGLSSMAGPPIAGILLDTFQSHAPVFYFAGSMFILSGCTFYLILVCTHYAKSDVTEQADENVTSESEAPASSII